MGGAARQGGGAARHHGNGAARHHGFLAAQCKTLTMTEYQAVLRACGLRRSKSGNVLAVVNPEN